MSAMKQYQIDVQQAVSQEVADVFRNAARMENTERIIGEWADQHGWLLAYQPTYWYLSHTDEPTRVHTFPTWEQCLAFLLEQVNGFALVDEAGQVVGVGENADT